MHTRLKVTSQQIEFRQEEDMVIGVPFVVLILC